jgi:lipid A 4'-phosphatase
MWAPSFAYDDDDRAGDDADAQPQKPVTASEMLKGALAVGAACLVIFSLAPGLDLVFARLFYLGDGRFLGTELGLIPFLRQVFIVLFWTVCTVTVAGLIMSVRTASKWLELDFRKWLFVALCLITGPLVVANIGFKDHWGRARPRDVLEFAGAKIFSGPFPPAEQCVYNCSFVSGEASSVFIVLFAFAFLWKSRSRSIVTLGILFGGLAGLVRMAQGGHFLSDVIFAGVLMATTAAALKLLFDNLAVERPLPSEHSHI